MNWVQKALSILQIALGIVPAVIDMVAKIEVPGNGAAKLKVVQDFIVAAFQMLPDDIRAIIGGEKLLAFATTVITLVVNFMNLTGKFSRGSQA